MFVHPLYPSDPKNLGRIYARLCFFENYRVSQSPFHVTTSLCFAFVRFEPSAAYPLAWLRPQSSARVRIASTETLRLDWSARLAQSQPSSPFVCFSNSPHAGLVLQVRFFASKSALRLVVRLLPLLGPIDRCNHLSQGFVLFCCLLPS